VLYNKDVYMSKVCNKGTKEEQKERRNTTRKSEKKQDKLPQALWFVLYLSEKKTLIFSWIPTIQAVVFVFPLILCGRIVK